MSGQNNSPGSKETPANKITQNPVRAAGRVPAADGKDTGAAAGAAGSAGGAGKAATAATGKDATPGKGAATAGKTSSNESIWKTLFDAHQLAFWVSYDRLKHSPLATAMTVLVIAIALALPSSFFSAAAYLQSIANQWHQHVQISLYLSSNLSANHQNQLLNTINQRPDVAAVKYISPQEGLKLFESQTGFTDIISQLPMNPLPPVIEVHPTVAAQAPQQLDNLLKALSNMSGVESAQLDKEWVEKLFSMIQLVDRLSFVLGIALAIAVLLTIGNTLRLILKKYQQEIELMNLLGASKNYIRRPYLYMGFLYGVGGALCAWGLLTITLFFLREPITQLAAIYHLSLSLNLLPLNLLPSLLITGAVLGTTGAWLTISRDVYAHG